MVDNNYMMARVNINQLRSAMAKHQNQTLTKTLSVMTKTSAKTLSVMTATTNVNKIRSNTKDYGSKDDSNGGGSSTIRATTTTMMASTDSSDRKSFNGSKADR
jgi:activator of HSP90 ATPase